ncbi:NCS2 family permease [Streptomyces bohaiensis]|uniref:NCS2 family permease n=1 Tax=Streptomyces bohaiensis TaxID=1431344 RepID=UPI003B7F5014
MSTTPTDEAAPGAKTPAGRLDAFFQIGERGSTVGREVRGGLVTFFTMAYILVLNPVILGGSTDVNGDQLDIGQLVTVTALVAAVMTILMGVTANLPIALAAGLGLNAMVAYGLAPLMTWPEAMGLVVLEGLLIIALALTGLREKVMQAIPMPIKQAIGVGIGLFIAFIGVINAGFAGPGDGTPVTLGDGGVLRGWPVLVFCVGVLLTFVLMARKVKGAILISIVATTALAVAINTIADDVAWGLTTPELPRGLDDIVAMPDFGLVGEFSLFGAFGQISVITVLLLIFTLFLTDFFDTMGTAVAVTNEAGLLKDGRPPRLGRLLLVDGLATVGGGACSASSNTAYIESASGVGEGARTGLANLVTGGLFALALFFAPLAATVPAQAASPALVVVGFLMMTQVVGVDWKAYDIAIPAFVIIAVMPFTYSITHGIGAGFITYVVVKTALGRIREVHWLMWATAAAFVVFFAIDPIEQILGVR